MHQHDDERSFDWADLPTAPGDLRAGFHGLHRYVNHLFNSGLTEDGVFDYLVETGMHASIAAKLIAEVQRSRREKPDSAPVLRSGPYDAGGVLDALHRQDSERRERMRRRQEVRKQSAQLEATDPDPAFELDGQPRYAQIVAQEGSRERYG